MTDRRHFISTLGGLVAASALPAFGGDDPRLFPGRSGHERLSLNYRHVAIGLEKPFSILHISDTHLTEAYRHEGDLCAWAEARRKTFGGMQESALADALSWAKTNVDYVLHTGDLIDFQSEANFDLVRRYYGAAAGTMFGATGNHEYQRQAYAKGIGNTAAYNALSRATLQKAYPFDVLFQSTVANGVNFIALEQTYGFVLPEQVARFEEEAKKGLPIVLCMHVPFMSEHIARASCKFWQGYNRKFTGGRLPDPSGDYKRQLEDRTTADFIRYLKGVKALKAILAGHLHLAVEERFSPTAMQYVAGGTFLHSGEEVLFT